MFAPIWAGAAVAFLYACLCGVAWLVRPFWRYIEHRWGYLIVPAAVGLVMAWLGAAFLWNLWKQLADLWT